MGAFGSSVSAAPAFHSAAAAGPGREVADDAAEPGVQPMPFRPAFAVVAVGPAIVLPCPVCPITTTCSVGVKHFGFKWPEFNCTLPTRAWIRWP